MSRVVVIDISGLTAPEAAAEQRWDLGVVRTARYDWWGARLVAYHDSNPAHGTCEFTHA